MKKPDKEIPAGKEGKKAPKKTTPGPLMNAWPKNSKVC